jgi:hypothetical protein
VFALKSSPGFLGLLGLVAVLGLVRPRGGAGGEPVVPESLRTHWRALWVGLVVFTAMCMLSPMNISVRHFSVPIILMTLMLAALAARLARATGAERAVGTGMVFGLAAGCVYTAGAAYPYYIPYVNALGFGRPVHALMNDSNVDWNQALPEVARFAADHQLADVPFDAYGFAHLTPWLAKARYWDCQMPTEREAGQWVIVSANMILESHNCVWLQRYPHETLGGGSVYAFQLPAPIPPAGDAGGPPLPADQYRFPTQRGADVKDVRPLLAGAIAAPETIVDINRQMRQEYEKQQEAARNKKK